MGALVLARPMYERLRTAHPNASTYVLCFSQNRKGLDLLDEVPADHVIEVRNRSMAQLLGDSLRALRKIRALAIDVVIDAELFARASAVYAGLSGAPVRVGFHRHTQEGLYRGDFINRPVLYNPYRHIARQFVTLADAIGSTSVPKVKAIDEGTPLRLQPMTFRSGEVDRARQLLEGRGPDVTGKRIVFLCPGAGLLPIRAWPLANYCQIARHLVESGFGVAVVGLAEDRALAREILTVCASPACVDLTGATATVRDLVALFTLGALLITNDGGAGHFAGLAPIPAIVLYGPETPVLYGSLGPQVVNLHKPLACSPCLTAYNHRSSPCDGDNVCLKSISPAEVLEHAYGLLGVTPGCGIAESPEPRQSR